MTSLLRHLLRRGASFLIFVGGAAGPAGAAPEAMPTLELDPYLVVAPNVWGADSGLYRDQIRTAKPVDLAGILAAEFPAAALTRKGPLAGDIVLRGLSRDNLVITVDDAKTFCACPNRMDPPAFHVSSQQIEGIRVRTGPFSVEQGASPGGTIAVRTGDPSAEAFARIYGYYGSHDYRAAGLTTGTPLSANLAGLAGFHFQEGGVYEDGSGVPFTRLPGSNYQPAFQDRTAFTVYTVDAKAVYTLGEKGRLTVGYAGQDAQDVLYPGLGMDAPSDTMHRASLALQLPVDWALADELKASLAFSHVDHDMRDSFRTTLFNQGGAFVARGYSMRTEATSAHAGAALQLGRQLAGDSHLRYGLDFQRRWWDADNLIANQRNDMLPDTVADTGGLWGVFEHRQGPWAYESGARFDLGRTRAREDLSFVQGLQATATNERHDVLPSLYGLVARDLSPGLNAYLGLGFASRLPDPQERYMSLNRPMMSLDWVGQPDLDPVRTLEAQSGLRWATETTQVQLGAFHAWLFDYIYLARLAVGPGATTYQNIDARLYGLSADVAWEALEYLRLEAGLAWQEGVKETYPAGSTHRALGEVTPLRARLAALLRLEKFSAKAEGQLQDDLDRVDPGLGEVPLDGWVVLNLSASYRLTANFHLSVGMDNAFDETYAVANSFVRDPFRSGLVVHEPGRFCYFRLGGDF